jgi:catalase-peroxidase
MAAARDIRETFARMAMNDEETAALIVGGHTFGKCHGAVDPSYIGPEPEAAPVEQQGIGWRNTYGSGKGSDALTSGLEGAWTSEPTRWNNEYLDNLYKYDWELTTSPAGAQQWTPTDPAAQGTVPDAHDPSKSHAPMMLTTDLALKVDPVYGPITKRFRENPDLLADAFAKAWYKLLHRDMGPVSRYLGPWVPEPQLWQDPVPEVDHELVGDADIAALKERVLASGLSVSQLAATAWASAATFRGTDKRGGANGARIRLAPQKDWEVNDQPEVAEALRTLEQVREDFNRSQTGGKRISLADLIVLGGCAAVEQAAKNAGHDITVPFAPGRTDASQEQTDADTFSVLEPKADGFRNYLRAGEKLSPETLLLDRANLLTLTAPEMTVLIGGMRALNTGFRQSPHGVLTSRPETLTTDFFINLLDMGTEWKASASDENVFEGRDRATGDVKWTATAVDLVFGANSQLRAVSEVYAAQDGGEKFVRDFVTAWDKVMNLDRFDLA